MIGIVAHDPRWSGRCTDLGRRLRGAPGDVALRIDHIGSTAVPGLAAKPIIDVQISVAALEPWTRSVPRCCVSASGTGPTIPN